MSPGCASGEEPYTLAMVLAEALGEAEFHHRVKIYATDMDQEALRAARRATFAAKAVAAVPPKLLEKYFEQAGDSYALRSDMRNSVIFGRHDVCHDAPISHLDLILCRNTLMYFNTEAQARALAQFHFGLKDAGYLFLGRAEAVLAQIELFTPVSLKHRIFAKAVKGGVREVAEIAAAAPEPFLPPRGRDPLLEWVINTGGEALIAVDRDGRMALANEPARKMFGLNPQDVGRTVSPAPAFLSARGPAHAHGQGLRGPQAHLGLRRAARRRGRRRAGPRREESARCTARPARPSESASSSRT